MFQRPLKPLRILTWHVHGSYLYYLSHCPHEFYLPVKPGKPEGYGGRTESYFWPANVHNVPAEEVKNIPIDCVLFQSHKNYLMDQYEILSPEQQTLPRIYLEHDPPCEHPTDTHHPVDDPEMLMVHVTHFNDLMWNCGQTPTHVIDHGVSVPQPIQYTGELKRGLVIVNNLRKRGRRLGFDIFEKVRQEVPLDIVGMGSRELGGLGDLTHRQLLEAESHYRFIFNPIRYTSLGLSICEAMMIGMPVIGLATTEMVTTIENGLSGYLDTNVHTLVRHMKRLLSAPEEAHQLGQGARRYAMKRFNIRRFSSDWNEVFRSRTGTAVEEEKTTAPGD